VPGLAAKPIIDIDVVISADMGIAAGITKLSALGYAHQGDLGVSGRQAFAGPRHLPYHHWYLFVRGSEPHMDHLEFRDYLRAQPQDADQYAACKIAAEHLLTTDSRGAYMDAKAAFVDDLLDRARRQLQHGPRHMHDTSRGAPEATAAPKPDTAKSIWTFQGFDFSWYDEPLPRSLDPRSSAQVLDELTAGLPLDAGSVIVDAACYDASESLPLCERLGCRWSALTWLAWGPSAAGKTRTTPISVVSSVSCRVDWKRSPSPTALPT
jgi:hypothetical protein